jgi:hypothetical protein
MKKNTRNLFFLSLLGLATNIMQGQDRSSGQNQKPNEYVRCYTVEHEADLRAKDPSRQTTEEFEAWLAPKIAKIKAERALGRNIQAVYNIPVVIHIIHDGDDVGSGENITDAQAISQITVMNQDYRRLVSTPGGANTTGLAVDTEINFVLAQKDPAGNPSTGVVRHTIIPYADAIANGAGGRDWETKANVETMKTNTQWDPTKYLNMWTVRVGGNPIASGGISDLLGYAQFPSNSGITGINANGGAANTDGVVSAFDAMGTNALNDGSFVLNPTYNLGRTMTHEVGHWLGLRHIWGDNTACPATNTSADKDYCADTPAANAPNYTCNLSANSCPANPGNDQVQNYMDYTNDSCMDTFTNDQKTRMQTVMAVSDRRSTLNTSTAGVAPSAGIYFKKVKSTYSPIEGTNCNSYADISYPVSILKAPSANAVVTFTVNATSTATIGKDFDVITPSVTLAAGTTTSQDLVIRYYNDGVNEASKKVVIGMTVNAGGGDAVIIPGYTNEDIPSILTCTILDDDIVPSNTQQVTTFSENFDGSTIAARTLTDRDGDTKNWGVFLSSAGSVGWGLTGKWAGSRSWDSTGPLTPDNLMTFTNPIIIPTGSPSLSFRIGANEPVDFQENYAVYVTTSNVPNTIVAQTPVIQETLTVGSSTSIRTINLNAFAGQSVYLSFRHYNCTNQNYLLLDDITIKNTVPVDGQAVQVNVNAATQYQANINTTGTVYAKDATSGKMIADIISATNFDYGCTTTAVSRDQTTAGAAAVNYGANTANNLKVMAKTVTITPTTNNTAGAGTLKFYFSEAEIAAWETATGNLRSALKIFKDGASATTPATIGAFGSNVTLSGSFTTGITGVYYFGVDGTLVNPEFEFSDFTLFPNPNNGEFTVKLSSDTSNDIKINIHDMRGRQVYEKSYANNGVFDQNIKLSNMQAGVYLVSISDGARKTVKRIVVE